MCEIELEVTPVRFRIHLLYSMNVLAVSSRPHSTSYGKAKERCLDYSQNSSVKLISSPARDCPDMPSSTGVQFKATSLSETHTQ